MTKLYPLFITCCAGVISHLALALGVLAQSPPPAPEPFPILSRFELARDYGYFLGDAIPLTLVVEADKGVVLDLVNLPHTGEKHGLFEIRAMQLTASATAKGRQVYRAQYTLQYFGATPLTVPFEPLEILYALPEHRQASANTYHYQSLHTQPVLINVSRIGPYRPTQALDIKGPVDDARSGIIWGSVILGVFLLLSATGGWGWHYYQHRCQRQVVVAATPSPAERTLALLRQEGEALRPVAESSLPGAERLSDILRQHLQEAFGISARTLTNTELATVLQGQPHGQALLQVLERCDTLKYQAPAEARDEERHLWGKATHLFETLHKADLP